MYVTTMYVTTMFFFYNLCIYIHKIYLKLN